MASPLVPFRCWWIGLCYMMVDDELIIFVVEQDRRKTGFVLAGGDRNDVLAFS